jgi:hypothetical protein
MTMEKLEPDQWDALYWQEVERARAVDKVDGQAAAVLARRRMRDRYGDPPSLEPVELPARPYADEFVDDSVERHMAEVRVLGTLAEDLGGLPFDARPDPAGGPLLVDDLEPAPPSRRGWLRRAMDRVFG